MSSERKTHVTVTPDIVKAVQEAARFYENVGSGDWLVFNKEKLRYFNPDLAIMQDKAMLFTKLANEMEKELHAASSD